MGKVCTKDIALAAHKPKCQRGSSFRRLVRDAKSSSESERGVEKNDDSRSSSSSVGDGQHKKKTVNPPHFVLRNVEAPIASSYRFFVKIRGIGGRNIKWRKKNDSYDNIGSVDAKPDDQLLGQLFYVKVNWDNDFFNLETQKIMPNRYMEWTDSCQFVWSIPHLSALESRFVQFELHEENKGLIGNTQVDFRTLATGTIHHDLPLTPAALDKKTPADADEVGRIMFDIQLSQICQLIINPIEVLVNIHERLETLKPLHDPSATLISETSKDEGLQNFCVHPYSTGMKNVIAACLPDSHPISDEFATPPSRLESIRGETQDNEEDNENEDSTSKAIERSAEGGHAEEDEVEPVMAEWQLNLSPTGVDNPEQRHHFSSWTSMCSQPYWNVIGSLLPDEDKVDIAEETQNTTSDPSQKSLTSKPVEDCLSPKLVRTCDGFKKLASMCRKGIRCCDLLSDGLPTIQLETTSEMLRQNYLNLKIYARRQGCGMSSPTLYGMAWIPLFKLYENYTAKEVSQHFHDSYFKEKVWLEGVCIGRVEGVIVFQNNFLLRQMFAGVHTENGYMRISPSILGAEHKTVHFVFPKQSILPDEVRKINDLHRLLLDILYKKTDRRCQATEALLATNTNGTNSSNNMSSASGGVSRVSEWMRRSAGSPFKVASSGERRQDIAGLCRELAAVLKTSHLETRKSFIYGSRAALLSGQRVLLNLANYLLEYNDYIPWHVRSLHSSLLYLVVRRGELDIGSCLPPVPEPLNAVHAHLHRYFCTMSRGRSKGKDSKDFGKENVDVSAEDSDRLLLALSKLTDEEKNSLSFYNKQMKLCRQLDLFIRRLVSYSLDTIISGAIFDAQRKFATMYMTIGFFRLADFRSEFLDALMSAEEATFDIEEWRGTEFQLDEESLKTHQDWQTATEVKFLLDWSTFDTALIEYFGHYHLKEFQKNKAVFPNDWQNEISHRGATFFSFLEQWTKHVYEVVHFKVAHFAWHRIPGYPHMLKALLLEMKERDVTKYPDCLLNCTGTLLSNNNKLLSGFIKIILLKTRIHSTPAVFCAMNFVDYWLQALTLCGQPLPSTFDFHFLRKAIDLLLSCDVCLNVAKCIWFLYKNLNMFKGVNLKTLLLDRMIEGYFQTMFLSWSWLVRKCFYWFLLYHVCESTRKVISRLDTEQDKGYDHKLTLDERIKIAAFVELSRRLDQVGAPSVFPLTLSSHRLFALISSDPQKSAISTTSDTKFCSNNISLSCSQLPSITDSAPMSTSSTMSGSPPRSQQLLQDEPFSFSLPPCAQDSRPFTKTSPLDQACEPENAEGVLNSDEVGATARLRHSHNNNDHTSYVTEGSLGWLLSRSRTAQLPAIREKRVVYQKAAVREFAKELSLYRTWVQSGSEAIPTMHIPASPLDKNVDVPLD